MQGLVCVCTCLVEAVDCPLNPGACQTSFPASCQPACITPHLPGYIARNASMTNVAKVRSTLAIVKPLRSMMPTNWSCSGRNRLIASSTTTVNRRWVSAAANSPACVQGEVACGVPGTRPDTEEVQERKHVNKGVACSCSETLAVTCC